jgi:hypothetical protein
VTLAPSLPLGELLFTIGAGATRAAQPAKTGEPGEIRTLGQGIKSPLLYR